VNEGQTPLRVVFLAFEFPPLTAGGVHRALAFAEHLPACDIALDVVTVRPEDYRAWSPAPVDEALARRIPSTVRVHRLASGFPSWYWRALESKLAFRAMQYAYWGDPLAHFWRGPLVEAMDRLVAERRPDVMLATMPPFGVGVLAAGLSRRYRLPWVGDWRDPWTLWRMTPFPTYAHYRYVRHVERAALGSANVSVATSHVTREDWLAMFPSLDPSRLVTIYNGYDPGVLDRVGRPTPDDQARRIVYVGTFYYDPAARANMLTPAWRRAPQRWLFYTPRREDWLYRSPWFFLKGLRRFADRRPDLAERLQIDFAGAIPSWLPAMLSETGTEGLVHLHGPVTHEQAIRLQKSADAVLLTSAKVLGGRDYSVAGKLFEYIGLRRPILGVLTDGAMRDMVAQTGLGVLADPDDVDAVADAIERVALGTAVTSISPDATAIARFERRETVRTMADCLRRAAAEGYRGS